MIKACIIGLGYVGLPILKNLSKKYKTVGYDNSLQRVKNLRKGIDTFNEFNKSDLRKIKTSYTNFITKINSCNLFIVTVPTPVFSNKKPNLSHLKDVCTKVSKILKKKDIIIFESTVYPGITNDFCIKILEKKSKLVEGKDFFVGYSPERVNPGDKRHDLKNINKILAYPHKFMKNELINLYSFLGKKIILTNNVKEAETAKVIENIQRDVNIGLINEFYLVCNKLNINFENVINLASTKWNFLKFKPGLVGGHCLPVDPYYLSHISKKNKLQTKITLAGRSTNDSMATVVEKKILEKIKKINLRNKKRILICGLSYKKDVADLRNSLSLKIFQNLRKKNKNIKGYDPLINKDIANKNKFISSINEVSKFDIFFVLTNHTILSNILKKLKNKKIFYPI
jgi:UDP-N-acetyl-D-galactosamine dehydrogenase